jgi:hypothetical protein
LPLSFFGHCPNFIVVMSDDRTREGIAATVEAHIARAVQAAREQDMKTVIEELSGAVSLYEQYPRVAHGPASHVADLLAFIRSAREICEKLGESEDELRDLEQRAEALRQRLH